MSHQVRGNFVREAKRKREEPSERIPVSNIMSIVNNAVPTSPLEESQDEILYHIISFIMDEDDDPCKRCSDLFQFLFLSFSLVSKTCHRVCIGYVQKTPQSMCSHSYSTRDLCFYHWICKHNVKIKHLLAICRNSIEANIVKLIATSCNLTELTHLHVQFIGLEDACEKSTRERGIKAGLPAFLIDRDYPIHAAFTEEARAIEELTITISMETFYRPILSAFAHSLTCLHLTITRSVVVNYVEDRRSCSNDRDLQAIIEAIENIRNLTNLRLTPALVASFQIRSESLEVLELCAVEGPNTNFGLGPGMRFDFLVEKCICPALKELHCGDGALRMDPQVEELMDDDGYCEFEAGDKSKGLVGMDVPDTCKVKVKFDPNWDVDVGDDDEWGVSDVEDDDEWGV